jgi:hypothetical protein
MDTILDHEPEPSIKARASPDGKGSVRSLPPGKLHHGKRHPLGAEPPVENGAGVENEVGIGQAIGINEGFGSIDGSSTKDGRGLNPGAGITRNGVGKPPVTIKPLPDTIKPANQPSQTIRPSRALPVIHISTMGKLGNQMIQFAIAHALAARSGNVRFSNVDLPAWGIQHPPIAGDFPVSETVTAQTVPLDRLSRALASGALPRVVIQTYGQRMENLLPPQAYAAIFPANPDAEATGPDELLINIRQGDILDGHHPDYVLIPPDFYDFLIETTGLRPVFLGQLEESPYMRTLRARFPEARFLPSQGPAQDFERIRAARNIVPAISTFSWLASWLSDADRIFLPVLGLLNPAQNRAVNLLPLDDARYSFFQFPLSYGCRVAQHASAHVALRGLWRGMPAGKLEVMLARCPPPRQKALYLRAFDEPFYRATHADVAQAIADDHLPSGRHHYQAAGFDEGRVCFGMDRAWYCRTYPIAAVEIAQGEFWDPEHHYLEAGVDRGYRRTHDDQRKAARKVLIT